MLGLNYTVINFSRRTCEIAPALLVMVLDPVNFLINFCPQYSLTYFIFTASQNSDGISSNFRCRVIAPSRDLILIRPYQRRHSQKFARILKS